MYTEKDTCTLPLPGGFDDEEGEGNEAGSSGVTAPGACAEENTEKDVDAMNVDNVNKRRRGRKNVITTDVAQVLDASKVSSYQATKILAAAATAFGVNIRETNINVSTVHRKRNTARENTANQIKQNFKPDRVLTVHWDGKIVPTLTGRDDTDRQAIVVTGKTTTQLLGSPKIEESATGRAIAETVAKYLRDWDVVEETKAGSFDTTSSNTGWKNGAAVWLEFYLEKELLWLPCRHHVLEIILAGVYHAIMGPSQGPEVLIFKRFQEKWNKNKINRSAYKLPESYPTILSSARRENLVAFAEAQINVGQPRDDYMELLFLSIIFLGFIPPGGIKFSPPGPMHSARWMAKAIYSLKVYLFRSEFGMSKEESDKLFEVCCFIVAAYLEAWFSATFAASAPRSDLKLADDILQFASVNPHAAEIAKSKLSSHLWYESEEMIGLAVFDEGLADEEREQLVNSIQNKIGSDDPPKKRDVSLGELLQLKIGRLGTVNTRKFFQILEIGTDFFGQPVQSWGSCDSYKRGKEIVDGLKVVNDHAERAVKLTKDYNRTISRKEEGFQDLLVSVSEFRKSYPDCKKGTILERYSL